MEMVYGYGTHIAFINGHHWVYGSLYISLPHKTLGVSNGLQRLEIDPQAPRRPHEDEAVEKDRCRRCPCDLRMGMGDL